MPWTTSAMEKLQGVLANLVLAGDYTDDTDPDQDHQIRVVLEIRGILLEM